MKAKQTATVFALLAAALYALNAPLSKLLLAHAGPTMIAALLYLGAGLGLPLWGLIIGDRARDNPLTSRDLPYTLGMILLDIAAPILLMLGLERTTAGNAALLNNFEIVATSLIAFFIFKEHLSARLIIAIVLVTLASAILGFGGSESFSFSAGSLLVLGAATCWGLENNCTRMLSGKSSIQITTIKGVFSGLGSLLVALILGESFPAPLWMLAVMLLGFVSYGLSINYYIRAQQHLGAAKTSAYYSIAPFLGVLFGMIFLGENPGLQFYVGMAIMMVATVILIRDTLAPQGC